MAIKDTDRKARANYKKKTPVIRIELYGTDDDIRDHLEAVKGAGLSVQGYIKELIRADIARAAEANTMLHRMREDLKRGTFTGVICSENGEAAIEHPAIIDRETYEAAQAVMKARKDNPPPPRGYKWQDGELVIEESEAELVRSEIDKYVRASSSSQREESIENQSQDCQEYAQRSGFITTDDHVDK